MSALNTQVGGDHYKDMPIQPMEYSMANGLDACQHTAIKYITRFRQKGGLQDLEKAKHVIDMLIEFERKKSVASEERPPITPLPTCPDCGAPEGDLHYVLCPRLPVPEAHAEAVEAAFAVEAALHEAITTGTGMMHVDAVGDVSHVPAADMFDEARADIIGQNGNGGEHYEKPVDVNDWRAWQAGDLVERISTKNSCVYTFGNLYQVVGFRGDSVHIADDWGEGSYCAHNAKELAEKFEWHSRPTKTGE